MKIFLSTHGRMASGMLSSIEILYGLKATNLTVFDAYVDERKLKDEIDAFMTNCSETETRILLCDLYGGSVCNTMLEYINYPNTVIVAGVTLSILLQMIISEEEMTAAEVKSLVEQARNFTLVIDQAMLNGVTVNNEDDFI